MKYIAFKPVVIKSSKNGAEYVKVPFLNEKGSIGEIFLAKTEFDALNFPVAKSLSNSDIEGLFKELQTIDISFDERGRCVEVK